MITEKYCGKCKTVKSASCFGKDRKRKYGLTSACKECRNPEKVKDTNRISKEKRKEYYSNPTRKIKYRSLELQRKFGLTHDEYEQMLKSQNGVCMICKRYRVASNKSHMAIDHCHKTGKIRGILCNWCNRGLGVFEDNKEFLQNAITYLTGEQK